MSEQGGRVVVITGASSGIGRATACAFARQGAQVVLAARRAQALEEVAAECRALGGTTLVVPTDVRDEAAVEQLGARAIEAFGGFDVWINNAGVAMFAPFDETPTQTFRDLLDTNVMGTVFGSRVALRHFRARERGVLIQVASALGLFAAPYVGAYVASKFAIVGLSSALRQELRKQPAIHVCTVLPAAIDTPIYQNSANYTGRGVKPMSPVVSVDRVAQAIVRCAERPRRHVVVGITGWLGSLGYRVWPGLVERIVGARAAHDHFRDEGVAPSAGNVDEARSMHTSTTGGWDRVSRAGSEPRASGPGSTTRG